jgi:hypothetical protein
MVAQRQAAKQYWQAAIEQGQGHHPVYVLLLEE